MAPSTRALAVPVVVVVAAFWLVLLFRPLPDHGIVVVSDLVQLLAAAVAAAVIWSVSSHRASGAVRLGWLLIGGEAAAYALGMLPWSYYELVLGQAAPFPSWADAGFLSGIPLALAGIVVLSPRPRTAVSWMRSLLDGMIAIGGLLAVVWPVVVEPLLRPGGLEAGSLAIALAYPVGYAAVAGLALRGIADVGSNRKAMTTLAAGLLTYAMGALFYLYLLVQGTYRTGALTDPFWVTAQLLLALAVFQPDALKAPGEGKRGSALRRFAPFLPVAVAVPVVVLRLDAIGRSTALVVAACMLVLIAARQSLAFAEQREIASRLSRLAERHQSVTQRISDAVLLVAPDGTLPYVTPSVGRLLGLPLEDITLARLVELVDPADRQRLGEAYARVYAGGPPERAPVDVSTPDGWRQTEVELSAANGEDGVLITFRDVTERVQAERSARLATSVDPLTSLPNREVFLERLERAIAEGSAADGELVVLVVDLDHFKTINDSLGHRVGDGLLVVAAQRLVEALPDCFVGRLGGDEFGVLSRQPFPTAAEDLAAAALQAFRDPLPIAGLDLVMHCSVGVARGRDGWHADDLLQAADTALYAAKSEGRDRLAVFTEIMGAAVRERLTLNSALPRALEGGELELWYQPLVQLRTGAIASFEALLRWRSPEHGLVSPARFIPLAEESGHIVEIGRWALGEACRQLAQWRSAHAAAAELSVAVNVSGRQMSGEGIAVDVDAAVRAAGIPPRALTIEVTESLTLSEDAPAVLRGLRELGVRIAMDDFGTGYSSLASLQRLPFDILKLDRAFLTSLDAGPGRGTEFLTSIVAMAHSLDLVTVAEGVETAEHLRVLREAGLDKAQGYLFGRPVPADQAEQLLIGGRGLTGPA